MSISFKCFIIGFDLSSQLNFWFADALEKTNFTKERTRPDVKKTQA